MSSVPLPVAPVGLSPATLVLPKERTYFALVLTFSLLIWLVLTVTLFGLIYAAIFGVLLWMANGLMTARLRSEAVRVDARQLPELHTAFQSVCQQLGLARIPALYVIQAGGALNAFAAKHAGRDFVVVFSDYLEALGADTPAMRFVLGHEIGHLKSRHLLKQIFLAPGLFLPLLGPAYRRSWESSCDRHGAFAAGDLGGAAQAMMTLSGGREHGRTLDAAAFARQHADERGFFVSLHELISTYPTLSKRVTDLLALGSPTPPARPGRHPLAYLPALFVPGGGSAAPANALVFVVIIGLLAAMALPAFQRAHEDAEATVCLNNLRQLGAACDQYALENGHAPAAFAEVTGPGKPLAELPRCPAGGEYRLSVDGGPGGATVVCTTHGSMEALRRRLRLPSR